MIDLLQEVRVLNASAGLVEGMVNRLICCFHENDEGLITEAKPRDVIQEKYFFVLLLEMFKKDVSTELLPDSEKGDSLLRIIHRISEHPQLCSDSACVGRLGRRCREFLDWLTHEFTDEFYSGKLGKTVHMTISREDVLYLIGNRCKHTLVHSSGIMRKLVRIYRDSGVMMAEGDEALVLGDIDTWFLEVFGGYHFTKVCELCSNVYHAIIEYVRPEHAIRARLEGGIARSYDIPPALTRPDHVAEFYELFNRVQNPWVPFIQAPQHLSLRY